MWAAGDANRSSVAQTEVVLGRELLVAVAVVRTRRGHAPAGSRRSPGPARRLRLDRCSTAASGRCAAAVRWHRRRCSARPGRDHDACRSPDATDLWSGDDHRLGEQVGVGEAELVSGPTAHRVARTAPCVRGRGCTTRPGRATPPRSRPRPRRSTSRRDHGRASWHRSIAAARTTPGGTWGSERRTGCGSPRANAAST